MEISGLYDETYLDEDLEGEELYFVDIVDDGGEFLRWLEAWGGHTMERACTIFQQYWELGFSVRLRGLYYGVMDVEVQI